MLMLKSMCLARKHQLLDHTYQIKNLFRIHVLSSNYQPFVYYPLSLQKKNFKKKTKIISKKFLF